MEPWSQSAPASLRGQKYLELCVHVSWLRWPIKLGRGDLRVPRLGMAGVTYGWGLPMAGVSSGWGWRQLYPFSSSLPFAGALLN